MSPANCCYHRRIHKNVEVGHEIQDLKEVITHAHKVTTQKSFHVIFWLLKDGSQDPPILTDATNGVLSIMLIQNKFYSKTSSSRVKNKHALGICFGNFQKLNLVDIFSIS
jgi:hypothetical protein